ncbi:MAG: hypothetical protein RQ715_01015 [Methylococcales bacterium]|nr:hypothetical protein [Methylococcales bacterium]
MIRLIPLIPILVLLSGCTKEYTPPANASGEDIYHQACMECHPADSKTGNYFVIDEKLMHPKYVALKVNRGTIMMPKFPNIKGKAMDNLSAYVLEHSARK